MGGGLNATRKPCEGRKLACSAHGSAAAIQPTVPICSVTVDTSRERQRQTKARSLPCFGESLLGEAMWKQNSHVASLESGWDGDVIELDLADPTMVHTSKLKERLRKNIVSLRNTVFFKSLWSTCELGMMCLPCNLSTWEAEAKESRVQGHPGVHSEICDTVLLDPSDKLGYSLLS